MKMDFSWHIGMVTALEPGSRADEHEARERVAAARRELERMESDLRFIQAQRRLKEKLRIRKWREFAEIPGFAEAYRSAMYE